MMQSTRVHGLARLAAAVLLVLQAGCNDAGGPSSRPDPPVRFAQHTIQQARAGEQGNSVPNKIVVVDVDLDGDPDLVVSHCSWIGGYVHPYVAWYEGPEFREEHVILDQTLVGENSRVYQFVMHDVDGDGRPDLIGQGYQPHHNGNFWYRNPEDPTGPWSEYHDYGTDLDNGHDIRLRDLDGDGTYELLLMDSHAGKIIVKPLPAADAATERWPFFTLSEGYGMTHYMTFRDVDGDGFEDIIVGREENGGEGVRWYRHPGAAGIRATWESRLVTESFLTKVFARDLDGDGDIDFVGTGEHCPHDSSRIGKLAKRYLPWTDADYELAEPERDVGWHENLGGGRYAFHEFDVEDNANDIVGGHSSDLVDVDMDGDEDLLVGGVDVDDGKQRFRWYEFRREEGGVRWIEHPLGVTSADGWNPRHGFYCGEMAWGDLDGDGDRDLAYSGSGSGFLGWFENLGTATAD